MKLTKYKHACFTVEKDGVSIVVDPGSFTTDFKVGDNVAAVIVTHAHKDHLNETHIAQLHAKNPDMLVIGPEAVTTQLGEYKTQTVHGGDTITVGGFVLDFYGNDHAIIHPTIPVVQNVGVLIDNLVYYPGDSFTIPQKKVATLALPTAAPWMKVEEAIEFMRSVAAPFNFPTHDEILSNTGKELVDTLFGSFATNDGLTYRRIDGETIDL